MFIAIAIFICSNFWNNEKEKRIPYSQFLAIEKRKAKEINVFPLKEKHLFTKIANTEKFIDLDFSKLQYKTIKHNFPYSLTNYHYKETNNFFILYSKTLHSSKNNVFLFSKENDYTVSFAKKGDAKFDLNTILSIDELNNQIYISDSGNIKVFDKNGLLKKSIFTGDWAYDISLNYIDYDLLCFYNDQFNFPIINRDIMSDSINFSLKDTIKDIFNYKSNLNIKFYSDSKKIVYLKNSSRELHIIEKKSKKIIKSFRLPIKKIHSPKIKLAKDLDRILFQNTLVTNVHFYKEKIWLHISNISSKTKSSFLGILDINSHKWEKINFSKVTHEVKFNSDYLYYSYNNKKHIFSKKIYLDSFL